MTNAQTRTAWLLGDPVEHSRSPALHNAAYRHMGLNWAYLAARVSGPDLGLALAGLRVLGAVGVNLTIPHKQAVMADLTHISEVAEAIGAVNTLRPGSTGWEGHNTDGPGWLDSWDEEVGQGMQGRRALIIGAGGAARAILWALQSRGVEDLVVLNRTRARAEGWPGRTSGLEEFASWLCPECLVVQTTSVGMWPHIEATPVAWPSNIPPGIVACDLVYNPRPTLFLRQAGQLGALTLDGSGMLVHQAARAIRWWSGRDDVPTAVMRDATVGTLHPDNFR